MDNFYAMEIQSAGIHVLESTYIIASSKNLETIKGRYEFLLQRITILRQRQSNSQYLACAQLTIEHFKVMHHGMGLHDYQLALLSSPNAFDINNFYSNSLVSAMKRFCEAQVEEMSSLKTKGAKIKRATKVVETIKATKAELQSKCSTSSSYSASLLQLENLEDLFNKAI